MKSAQIDVQEYSYFAGNQWREAADKKFFEVHEPYSGKLFARVAAGSRADACVSSKQRILQSPELNDSEKRAVLGGNAAHPLARLDSVLFDRKSKETGL